MQGPNAVTRARDILDPARDKMMSPAQRAEELQNALADLVRYYDEMQPLADYFGEKREEK